MIRLQVIAQPTLEVPAEMLIVPLCEDIKPVKGFVGQLDWWHNGQISLLYKSAKFSGAVGQRALVRCVHWLPFSKLLFIGAGRSADLSSSGIAEVHRRLVPVLHSLRVRSVTVMASCPDVHGFDKALYSFALTEGLLKGIAECADKLPLSKVNIPVDEERKAGIVDVLKPLVERHKADNGVRLQVT